MTVTYLKVEYREKDLARSLGARWDGAAKQWFIPSGFDPSPFAKWLPEETPDLFARARPLIEPTDSPDSHATLSQLLARISQAVATVTPQAEWVKAEISELRITKNGHGHLDLIELDQHKNLLGKASAKLFKTQADTLLAKFFAATQSPLSPGMKVLLRVRAQFHIQYGFSLIIEDIDPAYTLGDISVKLQAIREALIAEGLFARNKQLTNPREFYRLAVLSPQGAAGLGDFKQEADLLERFSLCHFHYYHAQFQGDVACTEIPQAFSQIFNDHAKHHFDAIVIIRGGGASIDLAWLNDLAIARALCMSPIPVFSGIGHERDNTILDEIANLRFDTPSKVIAHILNVTVHNATQAATDFKNIYQSINNSTLRYQQDTEQHYQHIITSMQHRLDKLHLAVNHYQRQITATAHHQLQNAEHFIQAALHSIYQLAPKECFLAESHVEQLMQTIQAVPQGQVLRLNQQVDTYLQQITENIRSACLHYQQEIEKLLLHSVSLGPDATLKRGFALAKQVNGALITSMSEAQSLTSFHLTFHDGTIPVHPDKG